jgi:hypothetical protein
MNNSEILKRIEQLERELAELKQQNITSYPIPTLDPKVTICPKCGMRFEGAMAYWCPRTDCPIQIKTTMQVSYSTVEFQVESLDPDERSWYYDGYGCRRKKEF